jgi:3-oxoacyl-[acyl-carrier-protein] synthase II
LLALYVTHRALKEVPSPGTGGPRGLYLGSSLTTSDFVAESFDAYYAGRRNPASAIVEGANCYLAARIAQAFVLDGPAPPCPLLRIGHSVLGFAMRDLTLGIVDEAVVVGVDAALARPLLDTWMSARILSRDRSPGNSARPFCATRRGFVYAEGAGCLILRRSGDHPLATVLGVCANCNRDGLIAVVDEDMVRCMAGALDAAGLSPEMLGMVHANANGSRQGDLEEARAIHRVVGSQMPVYASKALHGNTHGASGINNLIHAALILRHGSLPANPHVFQRDPAVEELINCYYKPSPSFAAPYGLLNTFGFGGMNASLVFEAKPSSGDCNDSGALPYTGEEA